MIATFKICRCCRTKVSLRKRVCPVCKVPAIWDRPTDEQQVAHDADLQRRVDFLNALIEEVA